MKIITGAQILNLHNETNKTVLSEPSLIRSLCSLQSFLSQMAYGSEKSSGPALPGPPVCQLLFSDSVLPDLTQNRPFRQNRLFIICSQ